MTAPRLAAPRLEQRACEFPGGCPNTMDFAPGTGRPPKYCQQEVGGVRHTRANAQRARDGVLRKGPERPDAAPGSSPAEAGRGTGAGGYRPVSLARASVEALREDLLAALAGHRAELGTLLERTTAALTAVADPDAAAAEVAAAHREARARIDAAEVAAEAAEARARAAQTDAAQARAGAEQAEAMAEQALTERDDARDERDQALAARDSAVAERDQTRAAHDAARDELERTRATLAATERDLATAHDELTGYATRVAGLDTALDTARAAGAQDRRRAEAAEQRAVHAETAQAGLADQLTAARAEAGERTEQAATARAAAAAAAAQIAALREQLDRERAHGEQRLTDQRDQYREQLAALRADLATARQQPHRDLPPREPPTPGDPAATRGPASDDLARADEDGQT